MKKITTIILLFNITLFSFGQSISVPTDTVGGTYDISISPTDYLYFTNVSNDWLPLECYLLSNTFPQAGWTATLCTDQVCLPNIPSYLYVGNYAAAGQGYINLHVDFQQNTGFGLMGFKLQNYNDTNDYKAVYFIYNAVQSTGISDVDAFSKYSVYPNPAKNVLNLNVNNQNLSFTINILDFGGKVIYSESVFNNKATLEIAEIPNGVYLIQVHNNEGELMLTEKFVKN